MRYHASIVSCSSATSPRAVLANACRGLAVVLDELADSLGKDASARRLRNPSSLGEASAGRGPAVLESLPGASG